MKQLLLVFALFTLFSCGNDEEVTPMNQNTAKIIIDTDGEYSLIVSYMLKDKWGQEEPYLFEKSLKGDTTINIDINREHNFGYFIQRQGTSVNLPLEATLIYKNHNQKRSFSSNGGMLWDIYEFYTQVY